MSDEAGAGSRLASWAVERLAGAAFRAALLVCRLFPARGAGGWTPTGRILVLGTFYNTNWFLSHARPLAGSGVAEVLVVTDEPPPAVERVRFAGPPRWVSLVLGRQIAKLLWARWHRTLGELAMQVRGVDSLTTGPDYDLDEWQRLYLFSRADTIYGGSDEIQLNVLAERVLGLPKEPR